MSGRERQIRHQFFSSRNLQYYWRAKVKTKVKVSQWCPALCNPTDYTVHGILQARILEWVALPFSRGSSQPRDWTQVSHTADEFFTSWAIGEPIGEPKNSTKINITQGHMAASRKCLKRGIHGMFQQLGETSCPPMKGSRNATRRRWKTC